MKLRDLLILIEETRLKDSIPETFIVGGTPRDKVLNIIKNEVSDIDLTCGSNKIHNLAQEVVLLLKKNYNITVKKGDDGHTSILIGDLKLDFSSNFLIPNIEGILFKKGIKNPTDMQKELFSRDFTCNTLLMTLDLKLIKDLTALAIPDIKNKILRTCLDPDTTFRYNTNRIIRVIYLSSKLDFDVEPNIIEYITKNKDMVRLSSDSYLKKNIDNAISKNPDRAVHLINKMDLWDVIPITDSLRPFYANKKTAQLKQNYDFGEGFYSNMDRYKSVSDFRKKRREKRKKIINKIKDMKLK